MKCSLAFFVAVFLGACTAPSSEKEITIKGKVQFPDNQFNMEIVERNGFDKTIIDSCKVNEDGTYRFTMKVDRPGVYTLDCQKWQSVQFWAEDEDLEIDFRGMDTARIKIKNPPYVYINGGPNNEVMNLMNWDSYRNYQLMIGVSQGVYRIQGLDDQAKQETSMKFYDILGEESRARIKYIAEHYADRNSVLAVLPMLRGDQHAELVEKVLARLEAKNPDYAPLVIGKLADAMNEQGDRAGALKLLLDTTERLSTADVMEATLSRIAAVSYTHLRAHET